MTTGLAGLLGGGIGLGLALMVAGLAGRPPRRGPLPHPRTSSRPRLPRGRLVGRLGVAVAAGLGVGLASGWVAGGLLAALAALTLPGLLAPDRVNQAATQRAEAVAAWCEQLRDTLAGAAGLEQAITTTAPLAPTPIRAQVLALAAALERQPLAAALRTFADELDDATGDLVAIALTHAAERPAGRLGEQLGALAALARGEVAVRLRVQVARAQVHTSVRVIVTTTVVMTVALLAFSRDFLRPYDTPAGQMVLLAVGGVFALAFAWLARLRRLPGPRRLLTQAEATR